MHFRKSDVCSNKLDVPEANCRLTQFHRVRVIPFDAGFRMDGVPALNLWDLVVAVLHSPSLLSLIPVRPGAVRLQCETHHKIRTKLKLSTSCLREIDNVAPNAKPRCLVVHF